ncbi:MAG: protoporphyrinogen oxidase [Planctomycetes bacterium]|nr:protoporphyrinogen oxidase [Planctomycetota bacterium]
MNKVQRVAVIGGGLAGLAAANRLTELSQERSTPLSVTLYEGRSQLGGIVGTEQIGDYLVDVGADSFLTNKPAAVELCRRLGIEDRLVPTDERFRGALVLYEGRPVPVPDGFQLLSPTAIWPILTTPILSPWGKIRLLMELFVPPGSPLPAGDESLADFVRRRFGKEALERLIQPLVGGIYTSDPEKLSLAATLPRFLEMEQVHGSVSRATLFGKSTNPQADRQPMDRKTSGARYGLFAGLKGGLRDLVLALSQRVTSSCDVHLNTSIERLTRTSNPLRSHGTTEETNSIGGHGVATQYELILSNGKREFFDSVIVALPSSRASIVLHEIDSELSSLIGEIETASSALVVTGHKLANISHPMNSFGWLIPIKERRQIMAVSFSSRKFPDRAPDGHILLRTFVGGALQPEMFDRTDAELTEVVLSELHDIFGVRGAADFVRVFRYPKAMPQYHVGHLNRVVRIESLLKRHQGLALAGLSYRGVGIPDVVEFAETAAQSIADLDIESNR